MKYKGNKQFEVVLSMLQQFTFKDVTIIEAVEETQVMYEIVFVVFLHNI